MRLISKKILTAIFILGLVQIGTVSAQLTSPFATDESFTFDFDASSVTADINAQTYLAVSDYDVAASGVPAADSGIFSNAAFLGANFTGTTFAEFHQFTLGPTDINHPPGTNFTTEFDLDSIEFDYFVTGQAAFGDSYFTQVQVEYSGGIFVSPEFQALAEFSPSNPLSVSVDLSSIPNLFDEEITFRIFFRDIGGLEDTLQFVDNISLSATAIPEPGSMLALASLGIFGLVRRRR